MSILEQTRLVLERARVKARSEHPLDVILVKTNLTIIIDPRVFDAPVCRRIRERRFNGARLGIKMCLVRFSPIHDALLIVPLGADLVQIIRRIMYPVRKVLNRETVLKVQREVSPEVKHPSLGNGRVAFELYAIVPLEKTIRVPVMIHDERLPDWLGKIETHIRVVRESHLRHVRHPTGRENTTPHAARHAATGSLTRHSIWKKRKRKKYM